MHIAPALSSAPPEAAAAAPARVAAVRSVRVTPDWHGPRTPFRHTWEGVVNVDQMRWLVRRDLQDHLALVQQELRATHVRAVGLFDDEMRVFCPPPGAFMGYEEKAPRTNWQTVDYVFDSLLDRRLAPMFTTSFVPSAMASGPVTVFTTRAHTSPPRDLREWEALVREGVQHAVDRYSLAVVRQWPFEVWNEPNLKGWFWGGSQEDFFQLWQATYRAIKSVDASLRVGGPSTARAEWVEALLAFGAQHDCPPDYIITHIYNNDSTADDPLAPFAGPQADKNSQSPNTALGVVRGVRALLDRCGYRGEVHWNEWGRSFHAIDHRREAPSEAAFVARFLADASQQADVFSYWCVSDIYDQVGYGREAFHGGYGLLNLQGLRKPVYHAFQLLSQLGTERVNAPGEGLDSLVNTIATVADGRGHLLVYAYDHADAPERRSLTVSVALPRGARVVSLHRVDATENNILAAWRDLGAPAYLSRAQTAELQALNLLRPSSSPVRCHQDDRGAWASFTLESPGLALLECEFPPENRGAARA